MTTDPVLVVGLGGSPGPASVTTRLLRSCLARLDAETIVFTGDELGQLPIYGADAGTTVSTVPAAESAAVPTVAETMVDAVRRADAVVLATPGYHGGMSGLVKNAIDHLEALRTDVRPYLDGRAVGVIVSAGGWQAAGTALVSVRSAVHALRGWPTPFGVTVNSAEQRPDIEGRFDARVEGALDVLAAQLTQFLDWQK